MHTPTAILLTSLLTLFSPISAVPACVVPDVAVTTLNKPFTLTAIDPKSSWSVLLQTPSATKETQPYISHTKIAPALFRLTDGNLTTVGAKGQTFSAHFGPTIDIFPPVLQPLQFGGDDEAELKFHGAYGCDSLTGKTVLKLSTSERE